MNNALLIQHVYENSPFANLLKVTAARNIEYCLLHKMDFEMVVNGEFSEGLEGDWAKVRLVRTAMELPYKFIIWLDADTVIKDMQADLRDACPPEKIGACRHLLAPPQFAQTVDHLNVGALYFSNCEATRKWVDLWLAGCPGTTEPPWFEQGEFNRRNDGTVVEIDAKWNATGTINPSPNPVVLGFHGDRDVRQRFAHMCAAIGK